METQLIERDIVKEETKYDNEYQTFIDANLN